MVSVSVLVVEVTLVDVDVGEELQLDVVTEDFPATSTALSCTHSFEANWTWVFDGVGIGLVGTLVLVTLNWAVEEGTVLAEDVTVVTGGTEEALAGMGGLGVGTVLGLGEFVRLAWLVFTVVTVVVEEGVEVDEDEAATVLFADGVGVTLAGEGAVVDGACGACGDAFAGAVLI